MGQTVNLLAKSSEVRILPLPHFFISGSSSFGRAIAFQAIGGEFEPRLPLKLVVRREMTDGRFLLCQLTTVNCQMTNAVVAQW